MSTRSNVIFQDSYTSVQIYRHHDGYPDSEYGVMQGFVNALALKSESNLIDAGDFAAACVATWKIGPLSIYIEGCSPSLDNPLEFVHGDCEYAYVVKNEGNEAYIYVYKYFWNEWDCSDESKQFELLAKVPFSDIRKEDFSFDLA